MQLTVSELIKRLQKIEARHGGGDKLVAAQERGHDDPNAVLTGIVIVEGVIEDDKGEVLLVEEAG